MRKTGFSKLNSYIPRLPKSCQIQILRSFQLVKILSPETGCSRVRVIAGFCVALRCLHSLLDKRDCDIHASWHEMRGKWMEVFLLRAAGLAQLLERWPAERARFPGPDHIQGLKITKDKDTSFVHPIARPSLGSFMWWPPPRGILNQVLSGGLHPKVQPLTLLYTIFDRRGTPFVYRLLLTNGAPFTYMPSLELCIPFKCCKYTVF